MLKHAILTAAAMGLATSGLTTTSWASERVTVDNYVRAETDRTFSDIVARGELGAFQHQRRPIPLDQQDVIRMNRDTLYSSVVIDLDAGPVTFRKPDPDGFYQTLHVIDQDHYTIQLETGGGDFTISREDAGSRYVIALLRTFADATSEADIARANALQDAVVVEQSGTGSFAVPDWDRESLLTVRQALNVLAATKRGGDDELFGKRGEVGELNHMLGASYGWGGQPRYGAVYANVVPDRNDGETAYKIDITSPVPVDGFVSITVYNGDGFLEPNDLGRNSVNNYTATRNPDGTATVHFGDCGDGRSNCVPITPGWNYIVRYYAPREEILSGAYRLPDAVPVE